MRYLSLCSGIEAATVAWNVLDWEAVGFSEIEPFPCAVLAHHYPDVPNLGDMTKIDGRQHEGAVDLIVAGTPCQSFSVAGLRGGLADPRGNLTLEFARIVGEVRARWLVWENVPGVLSADEGRAFGTFLGLLAQCGYGFAYRVLDARHFGIPQRRRRVFLVGHLGDWRPAAAVLFERESLQGCPPPSRETRAELATDVAAGIRGSGGCPRGFHLDAEAGLVAGTVDTSPGTRQRCDSSDNFIIAPTIPASGAGTSRTGNERTEAGLMVVHTLTGEGFDASEDGSGRGTPIVAAPLVSRQGKGGFTDPVNDNIIAVVEGDSAASTPDLPRLRAGCGRGGETAIAFGCKDTEIAVSEDVSPTLRSMAHSDSHENAGGQVAVAFTQNQAGDVLSGDIAPSMGTNQNASGRNTPKVMIDKTAESLYNQGINQQGGSHASAQEAHARTLLRVLREAVGEEAFTKWGLGILNSLQHPEVLRQALHGIGVRPAAFSRCWLVYNALSCSKGDPEWLLRSLRETECEGCPPQGWQPSEQYCRELGTYLSELSHSGPQAERFMLDLWETSEGIGLLRQALSAIQEVGRSSHRQGQPAYGMQVRRLTVAECEFLQGFPRNYTRIPWRGKAAENCPDGPRYRALGNAMAVPVMRWIGERIESVSKLI